MDLLPTNPLLSWRRSRETSPLSLSVSWNCGLTTERISGNPDAAGLADLQCNDADAGSAVAVCPDRVLGSRGVVECQVTRPHCARPLVSPLLVGLY